LDQCSKEYLNSSAIPELAHTSTKAEMISHCLNQELGAYGFQSYVSPDKSMVLIDDQTMSRVVQFLDTKGIAPVLTQEQLDRVKTIQKVSTNNKISIHWAQSGFRRKYYYLKQYGFNGIQLYNLLNVNTLNVAGATLSPTGAVALNWAGLLALSWSGSMFLSTLENYIPNEMVRTKATVIAAKVAISVPIRLVEWTANKMVGSVETLVIGLPLPTNVSEVHKFSQGPELKDLTILKKPAVKWLLNNLKKLL